MHSETTVLIIGGSLTGLSLAVFLSAQGVPSVVIERHRDTTMQYKFAGISPRTMEIYRGFGLEDEIRANRTGDQKSGEIASARNLADPQVHFMGKPWADTADLSAATAETCDQERLEPILRRRAERLGADVRFETEFVSLEQHADGVRAIIRPAASGAEEIIEATYLVAADGGAGGIRETLGIGRHGAGALQHWMNLIFDTDLEPLIQGRKFTSCFVTDINGSFTPRDDRWLLAVQYRHGEGERPADFDEARTRDLVRRGAGDQAVRADLVDARSWEVAALVADRFRQGRCFLIGDAAHLMPPTGGFGGNTGIQDAHNLAWKIAAVTQGRASPDLLDTYDLERRPIAEATLAQAMARLSAWFKDPARNLPDAEPIIDDYWVMFGQVYGAGALIDGAGKTGFEDPRSPSGRPGTRAPHLLLATDGTAIHDIVAEGRPVVFLGGDGRNWDSALATLNSDEGFIVLRSDGMRTLGGQVGGEHLFGIDPAGAALVRPDGFIAWRSVDAPDDPTTALRSAFASMSIYALQSA